MIFSEKTIRAPMNKEPLWSNKYIKHYDTERKLRIHHEKVAGAHAKVSDHCAPPKKFAFMQSKYAKRFQAVEKHTEIVRQNYLLLKTLAKIQNEPVEERLQRRLSKGTIVMNNMDSRKEEARKREAKRITRENIALMRRLYSTKAVYGGEKMRREASTVGRLIALRRQSDANTAGFIFGASRLGHVASVSDLPASDEIFDHARRLRHELAAEQAQIGVLSRKPATALPSVESGSTDPLIAVNNNGTPLSPRAAAVGSRRTSMDSRRSSTATNDTLSGMQAPIAVTANHDGLDGGAEGVTMARFRPADRHGSVTQLTHDVIYQNSLVLSLGAEDVTCVLSIRVSRPFDGFFELKLSDASSEAYNSVMALDEIEQLNSVVRGSENENEVLRLHTNLLKIFHDADSSHKGKLKYNEFVKIMQRLDLGISGHELRMIIAEADENDDGVIDYREFVPVAIELIQSFKARQEARKQVLTKSHLIDVDAFEKLHSSDLLRVAQMAAENFYDQDRRNTGYLSKSTFKSILADTRMGLSKTEMKRLLAAMPVDPKNGSIKYGKFKDIFTEVRFQTIRQNVAAAQVSDVEKFLMELCKSAEKRRMNKDHERDEDVAFEGLITVREMTNILINSKHLILSRVQVACILSEAEVVDGMLDYWKFVPVAAKILQNMFSPEQLEQRAALLKESNLSAQSLLHGKDAEEIENHLYRLFKLHDVDNSGYLDSKEFVACIQSLEFGLTISEIEALMAAADANGDDRVDYQEFIKFAYDSLLQLGREKYLRALQKAAENRKDDEEDRAVPASETGASLKCTSDAKKMARILQNLFHTADVARKGFLTASEFRAVLESLDLGITTFQMMMIMAEADENEDNIIQYEEFVPVCVELLQAFRAKTEIERSWSEMERKAERSLLDAADMHKRGLETSTAKAMDLFAIEDTSAGGRQLLSRQSFLKCLKSPILGLPRSEVNLVMHKVETVDGENGVPMVCYKDFPTIMETVRQASLKWSLMNQQEPSALEQHMLHLFREEEAKDGLNATQKDALIRAGQLTRQEDTTGSGVVTLANGSAPSAPKLLQEDGAYSNLLPVDRVRKVLENAKHLNLSRLQMLSIMSLADVEVGTSSLMNYRKFATSAAKMINKLFDVNEQRVRTEVVKKTEETRSVALQISKEEFEKRLSDSIGEFDRKRTGIVAFPVFLMCLRSIEHLQLTTGDYAAIAAIVPRDSEGHVFWREFLKTAYEDIIHLVQEKNVYHTLQRIKQRSQSSSIVPYLTRPQLVKYAENLVRDAQFSVAGNKLVVRPKKVNERKEALTFGPGLESYSESILVTSPKIVKPTAQASVETRPTSTILLSSLEEVELVRHAEKWDAKTALLPREKARFMVRIIQHHPGHGKDVELMISDKFDSTTGNKSLIAPPLSLKMPSIALADEEKAQSFAQLLATRVVVMVDDAGKMRLAIC